MTQTVTLDYDNEIAIIKVSNPPVNALSASVRQGLLATFTEASANPGVKAIVLICEGRTFIAGADITEFGKPMVPPSLPELLTELDKVDKPIVVALHGTALGGGLEVALTCHYRVAEKSTKVGLPEVLLGLLPGAGGTQRLPRLVGAQAALDMITSGRKVGCAEALQLGLVDQVADGDLLAEAVAFARMVVEEGAAIKRLSEMSPPTCDASVFNQARQSLARSRRGFEAPQRCVDAVEAAFTLPFEQGVQKEREWFMELMLGTQSKAQRHVFFAERQAAVIRDLPKAMQTRPVESVAIIGAGTMGSGIALNFSNRGIPVKMLEVSDAALQKGLEHIRRYYQSQVAKGRISESQADQSAALVTGVLDYAELSDVDLVIEAVFETMEIKKKVFSELDTHCKPGAILATNTSTLNVDAIAQCTSRPQDVIGLHFFSPANIMRLLEVVRGAETADDVLATSMELAKRIGKVGVVSGVCDGFIGNRMLKGYGREAGALLLEGASPAQIDKAMYEFGMAMGPLTMGDLAGLDVGYRVRQERRSRGEVVPATDGAVADKLVEAGRLGQKSGKGYYRYEEGSRTPVPDSEVDAIVRQAAKDLGIDQREISNEEIVERLIFPLINEGALILEEGIAQRPSDIDIVYLYGYGFPVYRGGPMFYADTVGLKHIVERMQVYQSRYGDDWQPAPLLTELASQDKGFADGFARG